MHEKDNVFIFRTALHYQSVVVIMCPNYPVLLMQIQFDQLNQYENFIIIVPCSVLESLETMRS